MRTTKSFKDEYTQLETTIEWLYFLFKKKIEKQAHILKIILFQFQKCFFKRRKGYGPMP